ncbi:MAG: hypothetical protein U0694_18885 [Anaerolineae bacterium]
MSKVFKLGIALVGFSMVFMLLSLFLPAVLSPLSPLFCGPGETLGGEVQFSGSLRRSTIGTVYWCQDKFGNQRNVNETVTPGTTLIFLGILFSGFGVTSVGIYLSHRGSPTTSPAQKQKRKSPEESTVFPDGLTEALEELEESRRKGLITEDEYQTLRQQVLDKFE